MTGIERYTSHVVNDLPAIRPDWDWTVIARRDAPIGNLAPSVRRLTVSSVSRLRRELVDLPAHLWGCDADLIHFPAFPPPLYGLPRQVSVVVTVHDANYWRFPDTLSRGTRLYYKPSLIHHLRRQRIATLLTHSLAAAEDVRPHVPASVPVTGIPLAVDSTPAVPAESVADNRSDGSGDYMLAVGTIEPRKNYETLFAALILLVARGIEVPNLRIVGREGWGASGTPPDEVAHLVEFLGFVDDDLLFDLYRKARLFVMPSLYEGFGLPLVEAMRAGCACLVSDIAALREVGGDTVEYVSPQSPIQWAEALAQMLAVTEESVPANEAGRRRAQSFSWERWGTKTVQAYETAVRGMQEDFRPAYES